MCRPLPAKGVCLLRLNPTDPSDVQPHEADLDSLDPRSHIAVKGWILRAAVRTACGDLRVCAARQAAASGLNLVGYLPTLRAAVFYDLLL